MTADLLLVLAHYDGANGDKIRQWLANLHMAQLAHGWSLVTALGAVTDNVARSERILTELERHGFIQRHKKDLHYAREILYFDVDQTRRSGESPLIYTFLPTQRLADLISHARRLDKIHDRG